MTIAKLQIAPLINELELIASLYNVAAAPVNAVTIFSAYFAGVGAPGFVIFFVFAGKI